MLGSEAGGISDLWSQEDAHTAADTSETQNFQACCCLQITALDVLQSNAGQAQGCERRSVSTSIMCQDASAESFEHAAFQEPCQAEG